MNMALAFLVASLALVAYAYAGYPAAILAWAKLRPRPVARSDFTPAVAILIVVRNGGDGIAAKIASCLAQDYPAEKLRVVVASDGSEDDTLHRVALLAEPRVTALAFPAWRGKAACLNDAVASCPEDFLVLTDVRQRLDPLAVRSLMRNFADPSVGAVSGELIFEREGQEGFASGIDAYWRYEKALRRAESAVHSCVGVTGALYALRKACFVPIPADTILDDVLVPMNAVLAGRRVVFEDAARAFDRPSTQASRERVRKVRTLAGNFQLLARHPALWLPWRNPIAWQVASHKAARLAVPLALAVALAANLAIAAEGTAWAQALLALQLSAYAAAAAGFASGSVARVRLVRLAMTFLTLNAFVVLGAIHYATQREAHLWAPATPGRGEKT